MLESLRKGVGGRVPTSKRQELESAERHVDARLRARIGARTSRPLIVEPQQASIASEIAIGGNAADETSALRYGAVQRLAIVEAW